MSASKFLRVLPALLVCGAISTAVYAKLPAPPAVDPAKAEEASKKKAEAAKKGADSLAKAQDRAVEHYKRSKGGSGMAKPMPMAAPAAMPMAASAKPMAAKK